MKKSLMSKALAVLFSTLILTNSMLVSAVEIETDDTPQKAEKQTDTLKKEKEASWEDKIEPYLLEIMEKAKDNEKIPVWLWLEEIDDSIIEDEVYRRTGLKEDNLAVVSDTISDKLAIEISGMAEADSEEQKEISEEFQGYLKRTEKARKLEKERVENYIHELRQVQKEMYEEYNAESLKTFDISEKDLIFIDTQAPFYTVYLSKSDIQRIAKNSKITSIYYYDEDLTFETAGNTLSETITGSTISKVKNQMNLTGNEVKVGIIDGSPLISYNGISQSRVTKIDPCDKLEGQDPKHSARVARIAVGNNGIASNSHLYLSAANSIPDLKTAILGQAEEDVYLINYSMSTSTSSESRTLPYYGIERMFDYYVAKKKIVVVNAAGNNHGEIGTPGLAYNVITVGGFFNQGTTDQSDDVMYANSNFDHASSNGCFKPDIVSDQVVNSEGTSGTSYAAPVVTGSIALLYEICPVLQAQPEAVKAIIMSSCHRKVTPSEGDPVETMSSGLTNHQGAGAFDLYIAISIAASRNYGVRTIGNNSTSNENLVDTINFIQPKYGASGLNVSLTWLKSNNVSNFYTETSGINLDMTLYYNNDNGSALKKSELENSSTEMVYITPSSNNFNYQIEVERKDTSDCNVKYAYAFSLNNTRYQNTSSEQAEGIFMLKNKNSGYYLNNSNGTISQKAYSGSNVQQWLLYDSNIISVSSGNNKASIGAPINGDYNNRMVVLTSGTGLTLKVQENKTNDEYNGTYSVINESNGTALGIYQSSQTANTYAVWTPYSSSDSSQQWYLEPVGYQRGDIDLDGDIDAADRLLIIRYLSGLETFTNLQKFLADVSGNGSIGSEDALIVYRIISGLE